MRKSQLAACLMNAGLQVLLPRVLIRPLKHPLTRSIVFSLSLAPASQIQLPPVARMKGGYKLLLARINERLLCLFVFVSWHRLNHSETSPAASAPLQHQSFMAPARQQQCCSRDLSDGATCKLGPQLNASQPDKGSGESPQESA